MSLSQPGIAIRDQFRAALVGTYLAEFRFRASSERSSGFRAFSLSALPAKSPQAQDPVDQLVELVPWLLQNYGQSHSQNHSQDQASVIRNRADSTQQMARLLAWSLEHLLDQRAPQTLLDTLSQRLCLVERSAAPSMIALLESALKGERQTAKTLTTSLLPMLRLQGPELFPIGVALYSFLRVPESYGLAVKYAFDCTHSSAISALTGLLAGVHGGLSQMPMAWLIPWLTTVGPLLDLTHLDLTQGDGLTELWSKIDAPFYQWMGAPSSQLTREVEAHPPVMPLPSI
ncbi:MAG: hypothetical protein AAF921_10930 [Cyanobacteria bacterium P01_D01_bin.44]